MYTGKVEYKASVGRCLDGLTVISQICSILVTLKTKFSIKSGVK